MTRPISESHISSGSVSFSSVGTLAFEPASTSRKMPMDSSRGPLDSGENGLSGESGSAAFLKNCAANSWYGSATSSQAFSTPARRACRSVSRSRTDRTATWCSAAIRS
jgi:hypothetical protein